MKLLKKLRNKYPTLSQVEFTFTSTDGEKGSTRYDWGIREGMIQITEVNITYPTDMPEIDLERLIVMEASHILEKAADVMLWEMDLV